MKNSLNKYHFFQKLQQYLLQNFHEDLVGVYYQTRSRLCWLVSYWNLLSLKIIFLAYVFLVIQIILWILYCNNFSLKYFKTIFYLDIVVRRKNLNTMHFIGHVTMLFANNSLMECLITMKFLHIFFTPWRNF